MKFRSTALKPIPNPLTEQLHQVLYPYGVGVDTHSKFIQVCVLRTFKKATQNGTVTRHEKEFPTTWDGLVKAAAWARALLPRGTKPPQMRYCIESTGTYHMPVLRAWGGIPSVVNPLLAGPTRRKTDVLDARLLAHHSITGVWKPSFLASQQGLELRVLWNQRRECLRLATRSSNRINNIILRFGHTFGSQHPMRSREGEGLLEDLLAGTAPKVSGICPDGLPLPIRAVIRGLVDDMKAAIQATRAAASTAVKFVQDHQWPTAAGTITGTRLMSLLSTVPGVGENTALTWVAEILDPTRFDLAKQVAAYCGCDPTLKISAGKITSHTRRCGNDRLHQALLYAAAGVLRQTESPMGQWGRSIAGRHKTGGHRKACGAVARRLATSLWHVHRKAEPFSFENYAFAQKLVVPYTPLTGFLRPPIVRLLKQNGIATSADLADAWNLGKLGAIMGIGETTIATIGDWVKKVGRRQPLDQPLPASALPAPQSPEAPGPVPPLSSGTDYTLRPAMTFKSRSKNKSQAQPITASACPAVSPK